MIDPFLYSYRLLQNYYILVIDARKQSKDVEECYKQEKGKNVTNYGILLLINKI